MYNTQVKCDTKKSLIKCFKNKRNQLKLIEQLLILIENGRKYSIFAHIFLVQFTSAIIYSLIVLDIIFMYNFLHNFYLRT